MRESQEPFIRIRDLSFAYGQGEARKEVLSQNNMELYPGELVIMSGPSGSGKTTLLSLIGALRSVQEGSLKVGGDELKDFDTRALLYYRRKIGFIFQHHNLFPALTAFESVRMALDSSDLPATERNSRTREILERLGLSHRLNNKPDSLSGGQRQRVAIGRALVHRPSLILADEPTAALDKETGRNVVDLMKELVRSKGSTALMVTHDSRLLDAADRIVHMMDGRIVSNVLVAPVVDAATLLRDSGLFPGSTPSEFLEVAQKMARLRYQAGETIITFGEEGDRFYVLREGEVEVETGGPTAPKVVGTIQRGGFFGERALISREPRAATIRARGPVEVYALDKDDFDAAIARTKTFQDQMLSVIFSRS
ncbi:MAG: ATP-binding cassette domain-containing protein [Vicinamibacteria bacterium]|nr:ATP-binding cassette domain-containing protein [Vicinamibacteria bacterium]